MSDWQKIKSTNEYKQARQEVRSMIEASLRPIQAELDALKTRLAALEDQRLKP